MELQPLAETMATTSIQLNLSGADTKETASLYTPSVACIKEESNSEDEETGKKKSNVAEKKDALSSSSSRESSTSDVGNINTIHVDVEEEDGYDSDEIVYMNRSRIQKDDPEELSCHNTDNKKTNTQSDKERLLEHSNTNTHGKTRSHLCCEKAVSCCCTCLCLNCLDSCVTVTTQLRIFKLLVFVFSIPLLLMLASAITQAHATTTEYENAYFSPYDDFIAADYFVYENKSAVLALYRANQQTVLVTSAPSTQFVHTSAAFRMPTFLVLYEFGPEQPASNGVYVTQHYIVLNGHSGNNRTFVYEQDVYHRRFSLIPLQLDTTNNSMQPEYAANGSLGFWDSYFVYRRVYTSISASFGSGTVEQNVQTNPICKVVACKSAGERVVFDEIADVLLRLY